MFRVTLLALMVPAALTAQSPWPADRDYQRPDAAEIPECRGDAPRITPDSIGPVGAGMTLRQIRLRCPEIVLYWDWGDEGIPQPAAAARFGPVVVAAVFADSSSGSAASQVLTEHPAARTESQLGPESKLSDLSAIYGTPTLWEGECTVNAWFERAPSLSWRLRLPDADDYDCYDVVRIVTENAFAEIPDAMVRRVVQFVPAG